MTDQTVPYNAKFKYDEKIACRYFNRSPKRDILQIQLVERAFVHIRKTHHVLDAPCRGGVTVLLGLAVFERTGGSTP